VARHAVPTWLRLRQTVDDDYRAFRAIFLSEKIEEAHAQAYARIVVLSPMLDTPPPPPRRAPRKRST
jgi:hypothetical protein